MGHIEEAEIGKGLPNYETQPDTPLYFDRAGPLFNELRNTYSPLLPFNMARNFNYLHDLMNTRDMNIAPTEEKRPAVVIASGPSLDVAMPYLNEIRENQDAHIFCGPTQMWALHYNGVRPDYIVMHDQNYRRCRIEGCDSFVYTDDSGQMQCMTNHHIMNDEQRGELKKSFHVHRWAPDIPGSVMLAQTGVAKEFLRWPAFKERGKMFILETNPVVNGILSRHYAKAHHINRTLQQLSENVVEKAAQRKLTQNWFVTEMGSVAAELMTGPNTYERQDIITDLAASLFGPGNPYNEHSLDVAVPIGPSTAQQEAYVAWKMGYDPIYFVGYDLCEWKGGVRHTNWSYDGTKTEHGPAKENDRKGSSGFGVDTVKLGEKELLLSYLGKQVNDSYLMPGLRCVEVVCDETPGNLELLHRIGLDEFRKGGTRDSFTPEQVGKKISETMRDRDLMI